MPNTAEAARDLLLTLSDDELARYGEIARDQAAAELSRWWLQAVLLAGAVASFAWGMAWVIGGGGGTNGEAGGGVQAIMLSLAAGLVLAYSPYRRLRNWTLWRRYCKAVSSEQARRLGALQQG